MSIGDATLDRMDVIRPTRIYGPNDPLPDDIMDPEYGNALLTAVNGWFGHFARYPSFSAQVAISLWAAHTHMRNAEGKLLVPMSPRLAVMGDSDSGKSTVLQLLNLTCARTDDLSDEPSGPAVRSMLGPEMLTFLLDEFDILVGSGGRKEEIRSILNASAYPNGHVDIIQGGKRVKAYVFGPVAIAALPVAKHSTGSKLKTFFNRAIEINMESAEERIPSILRDDDGGQQMGRQAAKLLEAWVQLRTPDILEVMPHIVVPAINRNLDKWLPLLAICEVAGGPWPDWGMAACLGLKDHGSLNEFGKKMSKLHSV